MHKRKEIWGECAMLLGLVINSIAVTLIIKSSLGNSPITSLPVILYEIMPFFTIGTWNFLFQVLVVLVLMALTKQVKPGYFISFFIAFAFGRLLDFWNWVWTFLPSSLPFEVLYFAIGMFLMSFGIYLIVNSGVPILPLDTFTRDYTAYLGVPYQRVKTGFDLVSLAIGAVLAALFLHTVIGVGIGIGTVISSCVTGTCVQMAGRVIKTYFEIKPKSKLLESWAK